MTNGQNSKHYDLEDRTLAYSKKLLKLLRSLPKNSTNNILINQCSRSGTSMGSNYREANETETKKDFRFRIRICRKEGKETIYWLELLIDDNEVHAKNLLDILNETRQLVKIFAAILEKCN